MGRTIVTERDLIAEQRLGGPQASPEPSNYTPPPSPGPQPPPPPMLGGSQRYLVGLPELSPGPLNLERGRKKEAELRKEIEEATREGDEVRATVLREIRTDLIRQLTQSELQDIYEVKWRTPDRTEQEPKDTRDTSSLFPPSATLQSLPPTPPSGVDGYMSRLLKYIPAESVALYLTLQGIILSGSGRLPPNLWLWIIFGIGVVGTPIYLARIAGVSKPIQLVVSTLAFGIWVFALGGAFASLSWYEPFIGSLALVVFTFFAPLIDPDPGEDDRPPIIPGTRD